MKILKNSHDTELMICDLEEAKAYFDLTPPNEDDYIGNVPFEICKKEFDEYVSDIKGAESLEELAQVLNKYSDNFGDGSEYTVKYI